MKKIVCFFLALSLLLPLSGALAAPEETAERPEFSWYFPDTGDAGSTLRVTGLNPGGDACEVLLLIALYRSGGALEDVDLVTWSLAPGENVTDLSVGVTGDTRRVSLYILNSRNAAPLHEKITVYEKDGWGWDGAYIGREEYRQHMLTELREIWSSVEGRLGEAAAEAEAAYNSGIDAIRQGRTVLEIKAACESAEAAIRETIPLAEGLLSYRNLSNAERTQLLGVLERYAVGTGITGISIFENGEYRMFSPRVTLGTDDYIPGYGFGVLSEGSITADMEGETEEAWKRYYHTCEANDPGTLNYWNDKGSQVAGLFSYVSAGFFDLAMNADKTGADFIPVLAMEKPQPVNDDDGDGLCTVWRFRVRTGADGLSYATGSDMDSRQAFNGRGVAPEDYITTFRMMLTQSNGVYRGEELAMGNAIAGALAYYNGTADGPSEALWADVGVRVSTEDEASCMEITFTDPQDEFFAAYLLSSTLFMPLPQDFIDLVGLGDLFGFTAGGPSPVDNSLAVGPYCLTRYERDRRIVFSKNPGYPLAETRYAVPGIHVEIFPEANEDGNAVFNAFLAGHFDSAGIPADMLAEYREDPRTRVTTGDSNFKLNVNAADAETWDRLFGENGSVCQTAPEDRWPLKPWLANRSFIRAMSYAVDRLSFSGRRGSIPSVDFFSSNYMSDPVGGISYNTTEAHRQAVSSLLEGTDGYGYSPELTREYFRAALTELEAEGALVPGTKDAPRELELEIAWLRPAQEEEYHNEIKAMLESAFNDVSVCGGVYRLRVDFWCGEDWREVYDKMLSGQFDVGFGSISGNSMDPLGFMSSLSSDQKISGRMTLNWAADTNDPASRLLVWDGKAWSYDALYKAATGKAIVSAGQNRAILNIEYRGVVRNDDGSYTGSFLMDATLPDITAVSVSRVACCNYERYYNGDGVYAERDLDFSASAENGKLTVTFTVPAELAADYATGSGTSPEPTGYTGFDVYYDLTFDGAVTSNLYESVTDCFMVD